MNKSNTKSNLKHKCDQQKNNFKMRELSRQHISRQVIDRLLYLAQILRLKKNRSDLKKICV